MGGKIKDTGIFIWDVMWPLLFYDAVSGSISQSGYLFIRLVRNVFWTAGNSFSDSFREGWTAAYPGILLVLSTAGSVGAAVLLRLICRERRGVFDGFFAWDFRFRDMVRTAALGAALCLCGNILVLYLPVSWESYDSISGFFYDPPVALQLLCVGLIVPSAEETLFRGVIYGRLRKNLPPVPCMVISALLFGLYHGNAVQAVYASILGLFLAWLMEYFGTLAAPCLLHMAANTMSVFLSNTFVGLLLGSVPVAVVLFALGAAAAVSLMNRLRSGRS